jgi:hypothetical protein
VPAGISIQKRRVSIMLSSVEGFSEYAQQMVGVTTRIKNESIFIG